jgi:hypothetical protein
MAELRLHSDKEVEALQALLVDGDSARLGMVLKQVQRRLDFVESAVMQSEFDTVRIGQWLTVVGLCGIILISYSMGHQLVLLMGALGGFLAPMIPALTGTKVWLLIAAGVVLVALIECDIADQEPTVQLTPHL